MTKIRYGDTFRLKESPKEVITVHKHLLSGGKESIMFADAGGDVREMTLDAFRRDFETMDGDIVPPTDAEIAAEAAAEAKAAAETDPAIVQGSKAAPEPVTTSHNADKVPADTPAATDPAFQGRDAAPAQPESATPPGKQAPQKPSGAAPAAPGQGRSRESL